MKHKITLKRTLSLFMAIVMLVGTITVFGSENANAADENLITNGKFDEVEAWVDQAGTAVPAQEVEDKITLTEYITNGDFEVNERWWWDESAKPTITVGAGYNGTSGLVLTRPVGFTGNPPYSFCTLSGLDTTGTVTYTVSFKAKAEGITWLLYETLTGENVWKTSENYTATEWDTYSYQFTTTTGSAQLGFQLLSGEGTLYIDDFSVTSGSKTLAKEVVDVVENGDFEVNERWWWDESAKPTITVGAGYNGTSGLVLTRPVGFTGNSPYSFCTLSGLDTTGTVTYTVSFKAKAEGITWLLYETLTGENVWKTSENYTATEWDTYSYQFTTTTGSAQLGFQLLSGAGTLYVDDFSVTYETLKMEAKDIAINGDFESEPLQWYGVGASETIIAGAGYDGTAGMVLTRPENATQAPYVFHDINGLDTTGEVTYTVSFKAKSDGITWLLYEELTGVGWKTSENYTATDWNTYSYQFTSTTGQARLGFQLIGGTGKLYVDDFKVTYDTQAYEKTYTEGIGTCNDAEADNVLSMKEYTEVKQSVELPAGTYNYSFAVKSVDTGSDFAFGIKAGSTTQEIATTSEWQTVSGTLELAEDATSFGFYRTGKGEVLIDDVVLTSASAAVTDHTPNLPTDYIPEGVTNLIDGDFTDGTYQGFGFIGDSYVTVADGRAKIQFNNNNVYVQTDSFTATKGHTYVLSYYIWLDNANRIGINMAQVNVGAGGPTGANEWKDLLWSSANKGGGFTATLDGAPLSGEITADTEGWKEVKVTWTAQEDGNFALILLRNYWEGTGDVYLDDVALYDTTPGEVIRLNYYDLGSDSKGYLVTSATDETVTITDSEGKETTVEAGGYEVLNEAGEYVIKRDDVEDKIVLYKRGDANADYDGEITAKDLIATKKKVEKQVIHSASARAADINADGILDSNDDAFLRSVIVNDYDIVNTTKGVSGLGQGVMPIIGYNGPSNAEALKNLSSLGMNYVVVNETDISGNAALAQKILAAAESNKMKVFLNNDQAVNPDGGSAVAKVDDLASYNQDYDNYSSFAGYYVADGAYYKKQYTSDSGKYHANNGIAEYAGVLGTVENYVNVNSYFNLLPISSEELAYSFSGSEEVEAVTYDDYMAYVYAASNAGSAFLLNSEAGSYQNLAWMRAISQDDTIAKPFYATVKVDESNPANMYLEANAALAFGAKGIQYNAATEAADGAATINKFIKTVDYILMDAESKGVITTNSTISDVERGIIENYGAVTSVTGENALVGCFDYFGRDTYLVVNTGTTTNTFSLAFSEAVNGTVITFAGASNILSAANNYQVKIGAGESVLVVIDTASNTQDKSDEDTEDIVVSTNMQDTVVTANAIANSVQAYYTDKNKDSYVVKNQNMKLTHGLATGNARLTSIQNAQGGTYLTSTGNTFDAVIQLQGAEAHYSSESTTDIWANTTQMGYYYYETRLQQMNFGSSVDNMYLEKTYHTYADKMYQEFRVIATNNTTESQVKQLGCRIYIPKSTVAKIQLSDGTNLYESAENIPDGGISNLQYAGFDINGVGVIGFIVAGQSNTYLHVNHDVYGYYISQYVSDLTFTDFTAEETANWSSNNMTMPTGYITFGNRVYTDPTHSFDGLVQANKEEQNPLTAENIKVDESVSGAEFVGYDCLTGAYKFNIDGSGYSAAYKKNANYFEHIQIKDVPDNRVIYLDVHTVKGGGTEGAALVDSNGTQIPVPMQVSKNFASENITPIYNNDTLYGATYMPLCIKEDEEYDFTVINAYWNWGDEFPIKQLSSIEYYTSYYHMSTGTVETTCIAPYYAANNNDGFFEGISYFLPDFRGMSNGERIGDEVQNNSVGVVYGPSNGSSLGTYTSSDLRSTGLTHSDIAYSYVSDDGAFKYTMRHVEMPQEDESRTYYTIDFEILKDTTLTQKDFEIIGFDGKNGAYNQAQYIGVNGNTQTIDCINEGWWFIKDSYHNLGYYPLQKGHSYFAFYDMTLYSDDYPEAGNFGLIVKDHSDNISLAFANQSHTPDYWHKKELNYGYLTLAADTTFKAGDTFSVDLILLPFGSVGDTNCNSVVEVYNDSAANAIETTAEVGTVVADTWVPTVKAYNNTAEFTLTGGVNANTSDDSVNYAVKVTGFDALTVPLIQQKVDGKWVTYEYATELGYDGYSVAYEDDGTYSYSFVFKQTSAGNTFRVIPSKNVKVSYYVDGAVAKTLQTRTGETTAKPDAKTLGIFGRKIEGYYTDPAFVQEFDFASPLTDDADIYVKLSNYIYINADMLSTMSPINITNSETTTDETYGDAYQITAGTDVNMMLHKSGLNLKVGDAQTLEMVVKADDGVDHIQVKLGGRYLTKDGTEAVATLPETDAELGAYTATSYINWPNPKGEFVTLQFELDGATMDGIEISKFIEITDIVIYTNPNKSVTTQSMSIASIKQELADTHTVTYKLGDTELTTQTVAHDKQIGDIPTTAIETHSAMMGYQVLGYYVDAECTVPYDFGNWIIKDTTVYVKKGDAFYISAAALAAFDKSNTVSTLALQENGSTRIIGTGDAYVFKAGLADINVENQTLEMRVKTNNVNDISMYCHGTYTKNGTEGSISGFTGGYYALFAKVREDSDGYSIYKLDFSNVNGYNWKTLTGFRIGSNNVSEMTLDIQYIKAVETTE